MSGYETEIESLRMENEALRSEINNLRNELLKSKSQLREIVGDEDIKKNGFLSEQNT